MGFNKKDQIVLRQTRSYDNEIVNSMTTHADNRNRIEVIDGDTFNKTFPSKLQNPMISFTDSRNQNNRLDFDENMMSTHILILGGIGTGKSNTFYHFLDQIIPKMTSDDILLIFDTKGDFVNRFGKDSLVIGNSVSGCTNYWNIFAEIDPNDIDGSIREICRSLFKERIDRTTNTYFPMAASDILYALIFAFYSEKVDHNKNNQNFIAWLRNASCQDILDVLNDFPQMRYITTHISNPDSAQTQGVLAELHSVLNSIFIGNFAKNGTLSMQELIRKRGGSKIFIEYDIKTGQILSPIYSLMIDLALKQALSSSESHRGNVFILIDEFKLLPNLEHIDDAIKMIIGLQSITQMYDNYGEMKAKSILSGFLNNIFFRVNNYESREYIKDFFGENIEKIIYNSQSGLNENIQVRSVVKDKDITRLNVGQAIVGIPDEKPFMINFEEYR